MVKNRKAALRDVFYLIILQLSKAMLLKVWLKPVRHLWTFYEHSAVRQVQKLTVFIFSDFVKTIQ